MIQIFHLTPFSQNDVWHFFLGGVVGKGFKLLILNCLVLLLSLFAQVTLMTGRIRTHTRSLQRPLLHLLHCLIHFLLPLAAE